MKNVTGPGDPRARTQLRNGRYFTFDLTFDGARRLELVRFLDVFFAAARFAGARLADFLAAIPFHPLLNRR